MLERGLGMSCVRACERGEVGRRSPGAEAPQIFAGERATNLCSFFPDRPSHQYVVIPAVPSGSAQRSLFGRASAPNLKTAARLQARRPSQEAIRTVLKSANMDENEVERGQAKLGGLTRLLGWGRSKGKGKPTPSLLVLGRDFSSSSISSARAAADPLPPFPAIPLAVNPRHSLGNLPYYSLPPVPSSTPSPSTPATTESQASTPGATLFAAPHPPLALLSRSYPRASSRPRHPPASSPAYTSTNTSSFNSHPRRQAPRGLRPNNSPATPPSSRSSSARDLPPLPSESHVNSPISPPYLSTNIPIFVPTSSSAEVPLSKSPPRPSLDDFETSVPSEVEPTLESDEGFGEGRDSPFPSQRPKSPSRKDAGRLHLVRSIRFSDPTAAKGDVVELEAHSFDEGVDEKESFEGSSKRPIVERESGDTSLFYFNRPSLDLDDLLGSPSETPFDPLSSSPISYLPAITSTIFKHLRLSPSPSAERYVLPPSPISPPPFSSRKSSLPLSPLPSSHSNPFFSDPSSPFTPTRKHAGIQVDLLPPERTLRSSFVAGMEEARMRDIVEEQRMRIVGLEEEVGRLRGWR